MFPMYFLIVATPFLLFHSIIPFLSDLVIGSDYLRYPIRYQMELLFSIKSGSFPLYVPGFGSGHSSSALTLGQIYHPMSHIASIMPGYWDGKAVEWNNFFKLLSLGFTQLILYSFLKKLKLNSLFSFLLSFITVYNLKILDLFRHGPPLEAYTGHLLLCAAVGWHFVRPTKWEGPLCVIGATYLLICSGHPEEMYYGLLGSGLFACVAPFFISTMLPDIKVDLKIALRFWLKTGCCFLLGIMLSSAYILPFYFEFISDNTLRVGQSYALAIRNIDTFVGTINNFFLPLRSLVYDAFGGSSLTLMVFMLPVLIFFKIKIPRSVWSIWGILFFLFLFVQGDRTAVHKLFWEYLPFASSIRTPGRISMIMPFFMMLVLAWVVQAELFLPRIKKASIKIRPSAMLAFLSLLLIIIYYCIYIAGYYIFSSTMFQEAFRYPAGHLNFLPYFWVEFMIIILGISLLTVLAVYSIRTRAVRILGLLLIIFAILQVGIVLKYRAATWIEKKHASPTFQEMQEQKRSKLEYPYYAGGGMQSSIVVNQLERTFIEPFLGKIYTHIFPVKNQEDAYKKMESERLPQQLFIEGYSPEKAKVITEKAKDMNEGFVKLLYSSFNRLRFQVVSQSPAFFGLSYPYSGHWSAKINGEDVPVYRVNGAAHAVEIPEGESFIEFRYWSSAAFWGMMISCTTFVLIGIIVCFSSLNGLPKIIGAVLTLTIGVSAFMLWYNSLYSGANLKTEYTWTYTSIPKELNLAYGKRTWVVPVIKGCSVCAPDYSNTRVVDGDRSYGSGFITRYNNIDFIIDLHRPEKVKTILLFNNALNSEEYIKLLSRQETFAYSMPDAYHSSEDLSLFKIELSDDSNEWRTAAYVISPQKDNSLNIVFDKLQTARYIKIRLAGGSMLSLDEVEIYGQ